MGRFLSLVPYVAALIAAAPHTLAAPAPTPTSVRPSSTEDSGLTALFGTKLFGQLGEAYGAQQTDSPGTPQQDGSVAADFMKMLGSVGQFQMPEPDMARYSNATPAPRWGATAQYMQGSQTIVFVGGQLDDQGHVSNETLALDMSGLTNLQSTRASVKRMPWLRVQRGNDSVAAPKAAYASSYVSTSVCGATDGHLVDTLWVVGGKPEDCGEKTHDLHTYSLEKKNQTLVGTWKPIRTNGTQPTRRSHAGAVLTRSLLPDQEDVALMVWGGEDVEAACQSKGAHKPIASSMDLLFIGPPLDQQCSPPKQFAKAEAQSFAMSQNLSTVPVVDYAAVQMPLIHNSQTNRDETPLLFLGGRDKSRTLVDFAQPWAMDLSSGQWAKWGTTGDIPSPRVGHSAVHTNDGRVLVYGGYKMHHDWKNVSKEPTDEMYMLDASHTPARWTRIHYRAPPENGPRPSKRAYHSAVMVDDVLVVAFGQQHQSTAYGLEKRGGTNENASDPLVMYMDTRENIMGFRWTDKLSAIVSARVTQNMLGAESTPTSATYQPTSAVRASSTRGGAKPTSMSLPDMSRIPTPQESSASVSSASKASASKASASKASASKASASKASASQASASQASANKAAADQGPPAQDGSNHANGDAQDGSNAASGEEQDGSNHANGDAQDGQGQDGGAQDGAQDGNDAQADKDDANSSSDSPASSPSAAQDDQNSGGDDQTTNSGAIAGGVLGAAALAVGAVVGGLYAYKKRRESQKIAELKSNGVLYDKGSSAPPVSSLWLQRPLRDVVDYDLPGRSSNLSGYSMQGHAGTPSSLSPAGGRMMGHDDRHTVRGPRSVLDSYATDPSNPYALDASHPYAMDASHPYGMSDDAYAQAYMPASATFDPASPSYGYMDGVQRSSGAEVTSNMDENGSMYANSVEGQTMVHGDVPRRSASFRFPETQAYAAHEPSNLRVMNN